QAEHIDIDLPGDPRLEVVREDTVCGAQQLPDETRCREAPADGSVMANQPGRQRDSRSSDIWSTHS
ncbi:hypothetical protein, partial [Mycobacterium avium]|uniref:hypothetical protein n=1 Tax=Mycobacterium avium TaxID=1764 RepID=UPI001CC51356